MSNGIFYDNESDPENQYGATAESDPSWQDLLQQDGTGGAQADSAGIDSLDDHQPSFGGGLDSEALHQSGISTMMGDSLPAETTAFDDDADGVPEDLSFRGLNPEPFNEFAQDYSIPDMSSLMNIAGQSWDKYFQIWTEDTLKEMGIRILKNSPK